MFQIVKLSKIGGMNIREADATRRVMQRYTLVSIITLVNHMYVFLDLLLLIVAQHSVIATYVHATTRLEYCRAWSVASSGWCCAVGGGGDNKT